MWDDTFRYTTKDGLARFSYDMQELRGCCGAVIVNALVIELLDNNIPRTRRKRYAEELYEDMSYRALMGDYKLMIISTITAGGVSDWGAAYYTDGAEHKSIFNLRHVAQAGGMVEGSKATNLNTGNEIVIYTGVAWATSEEKRERERKRAEQDRNMCKFRIG